MLTSIAMILLLGLLFSWIFSKLRLPGLMGLECGNIVLTVAVLSILITAPFGAIGVDNFYKKALTR